MVALLEPSNSTLSTPLAIYYVSPHSPGLILPAASYGPRWYLSYSTITLSDQGTTFRHGFFTFSAPTRPDISAFYTPSTGYFPIGPETYAAIGSQKPILQHPGPQGRRQPLHNLSTEAYDSSFQTFKVIYPDYARSHFVSDLKTVVTDTLLQRWSIHLQATDFYMMIDTDQGAQMLDDLPHSLLDILNWFYPSWKTHQHLDAFTSRDCSPLLLTPHPDPQDTGFAVHLQVIPRGHPFVTATRYTKTAA